MKNFFKKLSFVLAVAMVLTSIAPATASAAAKNYIYQSGKDSALTSVSVWFGDKATDLNVKINGKKNVAGTWKVGNTKIATVDKNGVITPVANGTTTVKFTAKTGEAVKATVVVGTRVKTVKPYLADDAEKKALTELALNIGEQKEIKIGLGVSSTAAKAGAKTTSMVTAAKVDGTAVEVVKGAGQRSFTVKAVAAGEATVTIGAHKTTALVQAGKFFKSAEIKVKVADKLAAKQTGANKITVTGSNLSDTLSDYVIKRGKITLSTKEVKVNDAKTEAVITSASSSMPKGEYTLSFKGGDPVAFTVEEAVVAKIVIDPEVAILKGTSTTSAVAYYKVFNQFEEDVTNGALGSTVTVSGSDGATISPAGTVVFTNTNGYTMNLSQVSLALVCNTNGVNVSKILTVSERSKLNEVAFAGVYKAANGTYVPATLTEGLKTTDLTNYYLFFTGVDQYGLANAQTDKLQVNLSSITGLTADQANIATETVDYVTYIKVPVKLSGVAALGAGDVTMLTVCLNSGKTLQETITVGALTKIQSLTISDTNGIYGGQENELSYEALDTNGNLVTDYASLSVLNNENYLKDYAANVAEVGIRFKRNADGTAKLTFTAPSNSNAMATPKVLTVLSPMNVFTSANVSILPNRVPKAIIGIDSTVALGATSGHTLTINADKLIYEDQYGNKLSNSAINGDHYGLKVDVSGATGNVTGLTTGSAITGSSIVFGATVNATTSAAINVKVSLVDKNDNNKEVIGSDYSFKVYSVNINDLANFTIKDIGLKFVETTFTPTVYGYYAGQKVTLASDEFEIVNGAGNTVASVPAIGVMEGITTKEATVSVLVKNAAGTVVTAKYSYSNAPRTITTVDAYAAWIPTSFYYTREIAAASNQAISAASFAAVGEVLYVDDQYEDEYRSNGSQDDAKVTGEQPYVTLSGLPEGIVAVYNGSRNTQVTMAKAPGYYTIHVKYAWLNGKTFEQDITIHVTQ